MPNTNPIFSTEKCNEQKTNVLVSLARNMDKTRTMAYINYKPAELKTKGKTWYIEFYFRHPKTDKWERFRKYGLEGGGLNRIKDPEEKLKAGLVFTESFNLALKNGWTPYETKIEAVKNWTTFQALHFWQSRVSETSERKKTGQSYNIIKNHLTKDFSKIHTPLSQVTRADFQDFLLRLKKREKWSNQTYNNYLRFAKTFFNFCVDQGYIEKSPIKDLKKMESVVTKHKYFDNETFLKIKQRAGPELLRFIEFLYETGLRPGESRLMKFKYVQEGKLFVPGSISKNKKDEYVPLSASFAEKLKGEGYIFGGDKPKGVNYFGNLFYELKKELKLDSDHTLYSVKHTRAVNLAKQGASPYEIKDLFRHSSLEITMVYLRDLGLQISRDVVDKYKGF